jgi:hypothetical protein
MAMGLKVDAQSPIPIRRQLTEQLKRTTEARRGTSIGSSAKGGLSLLAWAECAGGMTATG